MVKEALEITRNDINEQSNNLNQQLGDLQDFVNQAAEKKKQLTKGPVSVRDKKLREL